MFNNYNGNQGFWTNLNNKNNNFQTLDQTFPLKGYRKKYARPSSEAAHMNYSNRGYSQRPWHSRNQRGRQNLYLNDVYHGVNNNYKYYDGGGKRFNSTPSRRPISHRPYQNFHSFRGNRYWRPDCSSMMDYPNVSDFYSPEEFQPIDVQSLSPTDTNVEFPEDYVQSPNEDQTDELGLAIPCCDGVKVEECEVQEISRNFTQEEHGNKVQEVQCTMIETLNEEQEDVNSNEAIFDDDSQQAIDSSSTENILKVEEPDKSYLQTINYENGSAEVRQVKHILIEEILVEEKKAISSECKAMQDETVEIKSENIDQIILCSGAMNDQIYDLNIDEDQNIDHKDEYIDLIGYQEDIERIIIDERKNEGMADQSNLYELMTIDEEQNIVKSENSNSSFGSKSDKQLLEEYRRIFETNYQLVKGEMEEVDLEKKESVIEQSLMRKWNLLYVESTPPTFNQYVYLFQEEVDNLKILYSQLASTLKNLLMNYLPFAGFVQLQRSFEGYPIVLTLISNMFNVYVKEQKLRSHSDFALLEKVENAHNLSREKSKSMQNLSAIPAAPVIDFEENDLQNDNYKLVEIDLQVNMTKRLRRNSTESISKKSNYTEDASYIYFNEYVERRKCKEKSVNCSKVDEIYDNILDPRIRKSIYLERSRKLRMIEDATKLVRETDEMKKKLLNIFGEDADIKDGLAEKDRETIHNKKSKKCSKHRHSEEITSTADEDAMKSKKKKRKNEDSSPDNKVIQVNNRVLTKVNKQEFSEDIESATEDDDARKFKKRNKENDDKKVQQSIQQIQKKNSKRKSSEETDCTIIKKRNKDSKNYKKHRHSNKKECSHNSKSRRHSCDYRNSSDEKSHKDTKRMISTSDESSIVQKPNESEENVKDTIKSEDSQAKKTNDMPLLNMTICNESVEEFFPTQNTSDVLSLNIIDEITQSETTYIDLVSPAPSMLFHLELEESVGSQEEQLVELVKPVNPNEEQSTGIEMEIACDSNALEVDSSKEKVDSTASSNIKLSFLQPIDVEDDDTIISIESTSSESYTELLTENNATMKQLTTAIIESMIPVPSSSSTSCLNNSIKTSSNSSVITFASLNYISQKEPESAVNQNIADDESILKKLCSMEKGVYKKQDWYCEDLIVQKQYLSGGMVSTLTTSSANFIKPQSMQAVTETTASSSNLNIAETQRMQSLSNVPGKMVNTITMESANLNNIAEMQTAVMYVPGGTINTITTESNTNLKNIAELQSMQTLMNVPGGMSYTISTSSENSKNIADLQSMPTLYVPGGMVSMQTLMNVPGRMSYTISASSENPKNIVDLQSMPTLYVPGGMVNTITTSSTNLNNISEMQRMLTAVNNSAVRLSKGASLPMPFYHYVTRSAPTKAVFSSKPVMSQLPLCGSSKPSTVQQQRKTCGTRVNMSKFIKFFLPTYCIFVNLVRTKIALLKSDVEFELQAANIQNSIILATIKELLKIIDSYYVKDFSIHALIVEISKLGDLYFFLTVFVTNAKQTRTDFGRMVIDQMICTTKLFETMDFVSYNTARYMLSPMSYDQRVSLYAQVVKYRSLCIFKSQQMDQGSKRNARNDSIALENMYLCICGKIAIIICKCKKVVYCSMDCKIQNLNEHKRTCNG